MSILQWCRRTKGSFHCLRHLIHLTAVRFNLFTQAVKIGASVSVNLHLINKSRMSLSELKENILQRRESSHNKNHRSKNLDSQLKSTLEEEL